MNTPTLPTQDDADEAGELHQRPALFGKAPVEIMHDLTLTDGAVRLYAHMHWRYGANKDNREGRASMAKFMGVSQATITHRINELVLHDWVVVVPRINKKGRASNTYHIFELQADCVEWRAVHPDAQAKPEVKEDDKKAGRKLRTGTGGKPAHQKREESEGSETQVHEPTHPAISETIDRYVNSSSLTPVNSSSRTSGRYVNSSSRQYSDSGMNYTDSGDTDTEFSRAACALRDTAVATADFDPPSGADVHTESPDQQTDALMESERPPKPPVPPPPFSPVVGQPVMWRHYKLANGQWLYETPAVVKAVGEYGVKVAYQDDDGRPTIVFTDACQLLPRDGTPEDAKLLAYRNGCNGHTLPLPIAPAKASTPTLPPLGDAPAGYRWVVSANSTQRHIAHLSKASLERPRALCKEALGAEGLLRDGDVVACTECLKAVAKPTARANKPKLVQPTADVKNTIANLCYGGTDLIPGDWQLIVKMWNQMECPPLAKIEKFGRWWEACDWRGQRGDKPTVILLRSLWSTAQNWDGVTVPVRQTSIYRSNGDPDDNQAILDRSLAKMQAERAAKEAQLHGNG